MLYIRIGTHVYTERLAGIFTVGRLICHPLVNGAAAWQVLHLSPLILKFRRKFNMSCPGCAKEEKIVQVIEDAGQAASDNDGLDLFLDGVDSLALSLPALADALNALAQVHPAIAGQCRSFYLLCHLKLRSIC